MKPPRRLKTDHRIVSGQYGPHRESWTTDLNGHKFVGYVRLDDGDDLSVTITWFQPGKRPGGINLVNLTADELKVLREFLDHVLDLAEPYCEQLDAEAQQRWEDGDDTDPRLYRELPRLIIRERVQPRDDSGVQVGPERLSDVDGGGEPDSRPDELVGSGVSDVGEGPLVPEDNTEETHQPAPVREVDGELGFPV